MAANTIETATPAERRIQVPARLRRAWARRWVRVLAYLAGAGVLGIAALWFAIARDLPSVEGLRAYEPPLPTNVRDGGGVPIHSYARLRRVELSYAEYPPLLVKAFLAAEDRTFFEHHGVDYPGIVAAMITNLRSDKCPIGASTITQQVAKNLLVGNEVSYVRKAREALLAYKIEDALTKQQILELYLNQIELGRNAAGVEAAAHAYFDKELDELTLPQLAYLAILPKGPSNYNPERNYDRAMGRRNWVLGEMLNNGFITQSQHDGAVAQPLGTAARQTPKFERAGGYFIEEVRRQLIGRFGEVAKDGPSIRAGCGCGRPTIGNSRPTRRTRCARGCCATTADAAGRGRSITRMSRMDAGCSSWSAPISGSTIRIGAPRSSCRRATTPPRSASPTARRAPCRAGARRCPCAGSAAPPSRR